MKLIKHIKRKGLSEVVFIVFGAIMILMTIAAVLQ